MKLTFEQWTGSPAARLIKDAATNQPTGHALVALSSPEHASCLAKDMSEMIFMYAGAPRPLEAKVAIPGEAQHAMHLIHHLIVQNVVFDCCAQQARLTRFSYAANLGCLVKLACIPGLWS